MDIYQKRGYSSRAEYLQAQAADYGADENTVFALADLLGPSEDFDGLICALEDLALECR